MTEARVIKAYESAYPDPLILSKGESVTLEVRDSEWPGWIWAIDSSGKAGWVPKSWIERKGNRGTITKDYSAFELTVKLGDMLTILEQESGWCRCRTASGKTGWVPSENLALNPEN